MAGGNCHSKIGSDDDLFKKLRSGQHSATEEIFSIGIDTKVLKVDVINDVIFLIKESKTC